MLGPGAFSLSMGGGMYRLALLLLLFRYMLCELELYSLILWFLYSFYEFFNCCKGNSFKGSTFFFVSVFVMGRLKEGGSLL